MSVELAAVRGPVGTVAEASRHQRFGTVLVAAHDPGWTWLACLDPTEAHLDTVAESVSRRAGVTVVLRRGQRCTISVWSNGEKAGTAAWSASSSDLLDLEGARATADRIGPLLGVDPHRLTAVLRGGGDPHQSWRAAVEQLKISVPTGFLDGDDGEIHQHPGRQELIGRTPFAAFLEELPGEVIPRSPIFRAPRSRRWWALRLFGLILLPAATVGAVVLDGFGSLRAVFLGLGAVAVALQVAIEILTRRMARQRPTGSAPGTGGFTPHPQHEP